MSKQTIKWELEIKDLERKIIANEEYLKEHRDKLKNDTGIDFYEIQRRMKAGEELISQSKAAKKRIQLLKQKI